MCIRKRAMQLLVVKHATGADKLVVWTNAVLPARVSALFNRQTST
jgi:hypothetical protein